MPMNDCHRRTFLKNAAGPILVCMAGDASGESGGIEMPQHRAPANAADCHHHIYDSRFPADAKAKLHPADATVADYRLLQRRVGIARHVIVQPSTYGVDNRCMLDALRQFGTATARGIAVVN